MATMLTHTLSLQLPSKFPPFSPLILHSNCPSRFRCQAGQTGFFTKLGRLIKEKAKSDVDKIFSGFTKTRENLAVIDELLLYWNLSDTDRVLDELEEVLFLTFTLCVLSFFEKLGFEFYCIIGFCDVFVVIMDFGIMGYHQVCIFCMPFLDVMFLCMFVSV